MPSVDESHAVSSVDPASLLVAVFAVGVGPLTTDAPWSRLDTIVAVLVATVVFCFVWPHGQGSRFSNWVAVPQSIVFGFIIGISTGWPFQSLTDSPEIGSNLGLATGLVISALFYLALRYQNAVLAESFALASQGMTLSGSGERDVPEAAELSPKAIPQSRQEV